MKKPNLKQIAEISARLNWSDSRDGAALELKTLLDSWPLGGTSVNQQSRRRFSLLVDALLRGTEKKPSGPRAFTVISGGLDVWHKRQA